MARLDPNIMAAIGRELRLIYADVVDQGVPERFAAILRRLDDPSDEPMPPAALSATAHGVSRDEFQNGNETHESRALPLRCAVHSHRLPTPARGLTEALILVLGLAGDIDEGDVLLASGVAPAPEIR